MKKKFIGDANKHLKYPVTSLEDFSPTEKKKLLDATISYVPERADIFDNIIAVWHKIIRWIKNG